MARNTTLAWASFPSHREADQARNRLVEAGYARNSIDIDRRQDGTFTVEVHTREEHLPRVERLLHASAPMYAVRQYGSGMLRNAAANPLVMVGGAALAGLLLYALLPRKRRPTVYSIRKITEKVQEAVGDLPDAVSETFSGLTGGRQDRSQHAPNQNS